MNSRRRRGSSGSANVELALITPVLILIALLVVAFGRLAAARGLAEQAAAQAARAASLTRTPQQAHAAATDTTRTLLASRHLTCRPHQLHIDTDGMRPGGTIHVTLTCSARLDDLTGLRMPGRHTLTATAASPIDTYRSDSTGLERSDQP